MRLNRQGCKQRHLLRLSSPRKTQRLPEQLAWEQGYRTVAGVDEAGRGPWAGPVVAAAVVFRKTPLSVRLDDSKRLSPLQRRRAFEVVSRQAECGVGIVPSGEIDRSNILKATLLAMRKAIDALSIPPDLILVDGNVPIPGRIPCRAIVRGDAISRVIGAASIVAKVIRDDIMEFYDGIFPEYLLRRHKGYGTPEHAAVLERLGPSLLHRVSFEPVRIALAQQKTRESAQMPVAGVLV